MAAVAGPEHVAGIEQDESYRTPCATCMAMTSTADGLQALISAEGYMHLEQEALLQSAASGCPLCTMVGSAVFAFQKGPIRLSAVLEDTITTFNVGGVRSQSILAPLQSSSSRSNIQHASTTPQIRQLLHGVRIKQLKILNANLWGADENINIFTEPDDIARDYLPTNPAAISVFDSDMTSRIREKLSDCRQNHTFCHNRKMPALPSRVIDVESPKSSPRSNGCRLHQSTPGEVGDYVALSYCWGGPQDVRTTSKSVQSFLTGLPESLPKTIQDAIRVTRSLSIRYLWVDAFCIIQDDPADKAAEISNMGSIFKNATVTVAAASAVSVKDGFLEQRKLKVFSLPFYISESELGRIWIYNVQPEDIREPLHRRGWTFQELKLALRILFYGSSDLLWSCQAEPAVQLRETHNPYQIGKRSLPLSTRLLSEVFDFKGSRHDLSQRSTFWISIIEQYSGRQFSIAEDRLPALAGIVGELERTWSDVWIGGFWRSILVRNLAWYSFPDDHGLEISSYSSPGWSWATYEGRVALELIEDEVAELLNVEVDLVDENFPFGPVRGGRLTLRAPVLQHRRSGLGDVREEFRINGERFGASDMFELLLGFQEHDAIGLLLLPTQDGLYRRVGMFSDVDYNEDTERRWSTSPLEPVVVTIV